MCAISSEGLIAWQLRDGAYNSQYFVEFIEEKLVPYFATNTYRILVMDNASFHKTALVQECLARNNISYIYLPPYSLQLNPTEEFFSMVKARYKGIKTIHRGVCECVEEVFESDFAPYCIHFYEHMLE